MRTLVRAGVVAILLLVSAGCSSGLPSAPDSAAGSGDSAIVEGGGRADSGNGLDSTTGMDTATETDSAPSPDTGARMDSTTGTDTGAAKDSESGADTGGMDSTTGMDSGTAIESGSATDSGSMPDSSFPLTLAVKSGDNQTAYIAQALALPVTVTLVAASSGTPVPNATLTISAAPGVAVPSTVSTDATGTATLLPRMGLSVGPMAIQVTANNASPVTIQATAQAPANGMVFTIVNALQAAPLQPGALLTSPPGPSTTTPMSRPAAIGVNSVGVIYYGDESPGEGAFIASVDSAGEARLVTDPNVLDGSGNGGPPSAAGIIPVGQMPFLGNAQAQMLAFDYGARFQVRLLDFGANLVSTYAGGGTSSGVGILANTADFGNSGSSVFALITTDVSGNTYLWGQEKGASTPDFFVVTPSGILNHWPVTDCTGSFALNPQGEPSGVSDGAGNEYVLGSLCGTDPSVGVNTTGILAVSPSGAITHIAGNTSGSSADGVGGTQATVRGNLAGGGTVAVAIGNGSLYYGDYDGVLGVYRIRRINLTTNVVTTVLNAGVMPMAVGVDYVPASSSPMGTPVALATVGNNVVFIEGDTSFYRMRMIWNP